MTDRVRNLYQTWIEEAICEMQGLNSELHDVEAKTAKTAIPKEIYRSLSAFGNREGGGTIIFGVDERRGFKVTGIDDVSKIQHDLVNLCQSDMSYPIRLQSNVETVQGAPVVAVTVFEVPFQQKPVCFKKLGMSKGSFVRSNTATVQMTDDEYVVCFRRSLSSETILPPVSSLHCRQIGTILLRCNA